MNIKPEINEPMTNYAARLRKAAAKCDFSDWSVDKMIKCIVITHMPDEDLRLACLQNTYSLDEVLTKAQKKEDAIEMSKKIEKEEVNRVTDRKKEFDSRKDNRQERGSTSRQKWDGKNKFQRNPTRSQAKHGLGQEKICRNCGF